MKKDPLITNFVEDLRNGNLENVKEYINKNGGLYPDLEAYNYPPALCLACRGNIETLKYIMSLKPTLTPESSWSYCPIVNAAEYGTPEMIAFLDSQKIATKTVSLAFLRAAVAKKVANITALKEIGLDINSKDSDESTAATYLFQENDIKIAIPLIEHGARLDIEDNNGYSAMEYLNIYYKNFENKYALEAIQEAKNKYALSFFHTGLPYVIKDLPDKMKFRKPKP